MTTRDDLDRPSGRFVRNLALSLSGGAVLTLLGAGAAQAQDGSAGTASDGAGAAQSGDATAVGNKSGTTKTQTGSASGTVGSLQVVDQTAAVGNVGVAVADTGRNQAAGNESINTSEAEQGGLSGLGPATNTGKAANTSNGTATVSTGDATAIGNQSTTTITQGSNASGQLGNILLVTQGALVTNSGVALASTGGNNANGNHSNNNAGLVQSATSPLGLASNSGTAQTTSDGLATIHTGSASATGNLSDSKVTQAANGSAGGDPGGLALIPQGALVVNAGLGVATTGDNVASGNGAGDGQAGALVEQNVGDATGPDPEGPIGVASNNGEASVWTDGSGHIRTGDAVAIGNESWTDVGQSHTADIGPDFGISLAPQVAAVVNVGVGTADTGDNLVQGSTAIANSFVDQDIPASAGSDVGVGANFGQATIAADGSASIGTGDAAAVGNRSNSSVAQNVKANGGGLNLQVQAGVVLNAGVGQAITGDNSASGNRSLTQAFAGQEAELSDDPGIDLGVLGQFGKASAESGGSSTLVTGNASALGNASNTALGQDIDPSGLVVNTQVGAVVNLGVAQADTGGNTARGNESDSSSDLVQGIEIGADNGGTTTLFAGTIVGSNNGEASSASDGTATVTTGSASATGNASGTNVQQRADGAIDGDGFVFNTQPALVLNAGAAEANTGGNNAVGNDSSNLAEVEQDAFVLSDNGDDATMLAGIVTASNDGTASNASDGTATITTGNASAFGNTSQTALTQEANGDIDGLGGVLNTQLPLVVNLGVASANSGGNNAIGNLSDNFAGLDQAVEVASDNEEDGEVTLVAAFVTGANGGSAESSSDGAANVHTGQAEAYGNVSATELTQQANGHAPGIVITTQAGGVLNAGAAVANSGNNFAFGNSSTNESFLDQDADILSNNTDSPNDLIVVGPATASNQGTSFNASDGTGTVKTGDAQAQGNVSSTQLRQSSDNTVSGLGVGVSTQVGGVANVGLGVANSGFNVAIGNASFNDAEAEQNAELASDNDSPVDSVIVGPATASNSAEVGSTSDGNAKVKTGGALATGNASATNLTQRQDDDVTGFGFNLGTQVGGVANVGVGVANSGLNLAIGNISENDIDDVGGGNSGAEQDADILSDGDPNNTTILIGATAANSLSATNASDGEACVCTGDAVASGNVSSTTLIQDLNMNAGAGVLVVLEAGGVLNAGVGLANTGLNAAIGNSSENDAQFDQDANINDALLTPVDGPQTAHNGGTAANTSNGTALVASGNASGTGNQSTTDFVQAATVDGSLAIVPILGGTANVGLGLANSGLNFGLGNDSTNLAVLDQTADGSGIVSNQGEATNDSDGTAIIGNPEDCEDEPTGEGKPGAPGLPRTGAELEVQAAIGLMLLLLGFGLQRRSRRLA